MLCLFVPIQKHTESITVPIYYELKEPKAESCDGSEGEIIRRIPDKVKVETDGDWETTASYHKVSERRDLKIEEIDAADSEETLSADELSSLLSHGGSLPPVTCRICDKTVRDKYSLQVHMSSHRRKNVYCEICDRWYENSKYQLHLQISLKHHNKDDLDASFQCSVCNKRYTCKKYLESHMTYMHGKQKTGVYCRKCDKWFKPMSYKSHLKTSSNHISEDEKRYTCDHCNKKFIHYNTMKQHILCKHLNIRLFKCPHCPQEYSAKNGLVYHVQRKHERRPVTWDHVCEVCGKKFQTGSLLRKHMPVHTGERPYKCGKCDATFGHDSARYLHNRYVHEKKKCPPKKKKNTTKNMG
ncbi:hypothetical protein O0L34_g10620 [Tuta absoluta]|nr:hypothetical protein O0L34_g10620 [Tuta absoluta]